MRSNSKSLTAKIMETNSNHSANESANTTEKMLTDSTKEIMDFYTKQLNAATGFYKNLFDSFSNSNKGWNTNSDFSTGFLNNDIMKSFLMPFNNMNTYFTNPFIPSYDKIYKQLIDYNSNLFNRLTSSLKDSSDLSEINKKYREMITSQTETTKNSLKIAAEAYNNLINLSIENNKKILEEMNNQISALVEQNQLFWSGLTESAQVLPTNTEKTVKESVNPEIKKRSSIATTGLSDHKG